MTENSDPNNYSYSGYGFGFNTCKSFLLSDGSGFGKIVVMFGADMSSSVHTDKKRTSSFLVKNV